MVTGLKRGSWPTRTPPNGQARSHTPHQHIARAIVLKLDLNKPGPLFEYPPAIKRHKSFIKDNQVKNLQISKRSHVKTAANWELESKQGS